MRSSLVQLTCRSHNPFTPSIVLRQHFILPATPSRPQHRPLSSTAPVFEAVSPTSSRNDVPATDDDSAGTKVDEFVQPETTTSLNIVKVRTRPRSARVQLGDSMVAMQREIASKGDYQGVITPRVFISEMAPVERYPWAALENRSSNGSQRMSAEIVDFHAYMRPTRFEVVARQQLVKQVRTHVREVLPSSVLQLFGSERTGLAVATSDIDLRLTRPARVAPNAANAKPPRPAERSQMRKYLFALEKRLASKYDYSLCVLRHARYPLLALQDRASGLDVQIVLSNDTSGSMDKMRTYMDQHPYLRELYTVVKAMFDVRGFSDVYRGGFGSYPIFMMVVAALRHEPLLADDPTPAAGLLAFLDFWGRFDTYKYGVSVDPFEIFVKDQEDIIPAKAKAKAEANSTVPLPFLLSLRDPADPTNDLGRKGLCIKHVQLTCKHLAEQVRKNITRNTSSSLLSVIVKPIYEYNYARRRKLEVRGRRLRYLGPHPLPANANGNPEESVELPVEPNTPKIPGQLAEEQAIAESFRTPSSNPSEKGPDNDVESGKSVGAVVLESSKDRPVSI